MSSSERRPRWTKSRYNQELRERVKALGERVGWTAAQMVTAPDVPAEHYRTFESRSPLPLRLIERFALITGVDVEGLVAGMGLR